VSLTTCRFNLPEEKGPRARWVGSWVGPRAGLDVVGVGKNLVHAENSTPEVQLVACRYTDWAIPILRKYVYKYVYNSIQLHTEKAGGEEQWNKQNAI
jgi:hypothetical protein